MKETTEMSKLHKRHSERLTTLKNTWPGGKYDWHTTHLTLMVYQHSSSHAAVRIQDHKSTSGKDLCDRVPYSATPPAVTMTPITGTELGKEESWNDFARFSVFPHEDPLWVRRERSLLLSNKEESLIQRKPNSQEPFSQPLGTLDEAQRRTCSWISKGCHRWHHGSSPRASTGSYCWWLPAGAALEQSLLLLLRSDEMKGSCWAGMRVCKTGKSCRRSKPCCQAVPEKDTLFHLALWGSKKLGASCIGKTERETCARILPLAALPLSASSAEFCLTLPAAAQCKNRRQ